MSRIKILAFAILLGAPGITNAQKETPPKGGPAKDFRLPAKSVKTLSNGMRTTLVKYGTIPKVTVTLLISTGKVHEAANENGLASLTASMIKQGTITMDYKTLSAKIAAMGGELDVSSASETTTITGSVLSEFAPALIEVLADLAIKPALPASELERLKQNLKRQLSVDKTVPQAVAEDAYSKAIYGNHPFGYGFTSDKIIESFTKQKVQEFYTKNFGAARSSLFVVGNYDSSQVQKAITKSFGPWKAGPQRFSPAFTTKVKSDTLIVDRKDAPQTTVMMGLPVISPQHKDYMAMLVVDALLGSSFGSRITSNIRENKGYTYSPYSYIFARKAGSVWTEIADITSDQTYNALTEIKKEIVLLQNTVPNEDELKGIQNYLNGYFVLKNSNAEGIITQLYFMEKHQLPDSFLTGYIRNINSITPKQVSEITKKYIDLSKMTVIMVGDKELLQKQYQATQPKKAF